MQSIMTAFSLNATVTIDPSRPFCAKTYFQALRNCGLQPYVSGNGDAAEGIGMLLANQCEAGEEAQVWHEWAIAGDQQQTARVQYAKAVWAQRPDGVKLVALGV
jgi:hypothetical protein